MSEKFEVAKHMADRILEMRNLLAASFFAAMVLLAMAGFPLFGALLKPELDKAGGHVMLYMGAVMMVPFLVMLAYCLFVWHSKKILKEDLARICLEYHDRHGFETPEMMIAAAIGAAQQEGPRDQAKLCREERDRRKSLQSIYARALQS